MLVYITMEKLFKTRQEIARELGVDVKTLKRYLRNYEFELKPGLVPRGVADEIKEKIKIFRSSNISAENGTDFEDNKN